MQTRQIISPDVGQKTASYSHIFKYSDFKSKVNSWTECFHPRASTKAKVLHFRTNRIAAYKRPHGKFNKLSSAFDWLVNISDVLAVKLRKKKKEKSINHHQKELFRGKQTAEFYRLSQKRQEKSVFVERLKSRRAVTLHGKHSAPAVERSPQGLSWLFGKSRRPWRRFQSRTCSRRSQRCADFIVDIVPVRPWTRRESFHRMKLKRKLFLSYRGTRIGLHGRRAT